MLRTDNDDGLYSDLETIKPKMALLGQRYARGDASPDWHRIPKNPPAGTRKLSTPWQCGLCDMRRATKHKIPGCKRPAWFSVPHKAYARMPICAYHLREEAAALLMDTATLARRRKARLEALKLRG